MTQEPGFGPLPAPGRSGLDIRPGKVTIVDVARAAGFSVATVSRALRGFTNVAPDTVATVKRVAESLGYRPNPVAAQLRSGATRAVTIVVPAIESWYYAEVMASAQVVLDQEGYRTFVMVAGDDEGLGRVIDAMGLGRADGLIVVDLAVSSATASEVASLSLSMVSAGLTAEGFPSIQVDDRRIGYNATRHLIELGHRRIAMVRWSAGAGRVEGSNLRVAGYHQALAEAGIDPDPDLDLVFERTASGGLEAGAALAARRDPPTAVLCLSDMMAMGVTHTFGDLGFELPAELSVVGVGDRPTAAIMGLTTVALPLRELGAGAARLLLDTIGQPGPAENVVLPAELVVRRSTAPPRRR